MAGAISEALVLGDYDEVGIVVDWERASARLERLATSTAAMRCGRGRSICWSRMWA